jgi:signal transduction histidine kinase
VSTLSYAPPVAAATPGPGSRSAGRDTLLRDGAVAAGLAVLVTVGTWFASHHRHAARPFDAGTLAILLVASASLTWRRRHPVPVLGAVFAATAVYGLLGYASGPIWLALILAYATAIVRGHRLTAGVAAVAGFVLLPWLGAVVGHQQPPSLTFLVALASWLLLLSGAAELVRIRRVRAAEAARVREEEARRRASEERLRIARDLHDVLAHSISLITVQAGVALHLHDQLPEQVRAALEAIRQASREALGELRSALEVLRQTGEEPPRRPAPGLDQLDELLAGARAAGLDVHVDVRGERRRLQAGVDLAAYRIVQEAVTNVIRHARASRVWVGITYGRGALDLRVEDDGPGMAAAVAPASGTGITGMRERAEALGGGLEAGPGAEGGFRVVARLPLEATA